MPLRDHSSSSVRRIATIFMAAVILLVLLALPGCDERLNGGYAETSGFGRLDFHEDGRVYVTLGLASSTFVAEYEVDGDKIIITGPGGSQVYTVGEDGSIEGGMGMRYVRNGEAPLAAGHASGQ